MANPAALPAPGPLRTPEQLVRRMAELRQWAGQPSLRTLRRLAGTTTTTSGTVIDALPSSTTSYLLNGRGLPRPPRLELLDAFVTACLLAVDHPVHQISPVVQEWRSTWRAVSVTDVDRPPSPSSRPDHEPSPNPGLDQSAVAGDRPALPRRSFIRSRTVLAAVGAFALGATAAVVVLDWGRAGSTASTPTAARQTSMVREVRRGTVSALGDKQGIDLDLGGSWHRHLALCAGQLRQHQIRCVASAARRTGCGDLSGVRVPAGRCPEDGGRWTACRGGGPPAVRLDPRGTGGHGHPRPGALTA